MTDLLGKGVGDLQQDIVFTSYSVHGTLKKVTDYTNFSSEPDEQSGYYLAFIVNPPKGVQESSPTVTVNDVILDEDRIHITRVASSDGTILRKEIIIKAKWTTEGEEKTTKIALNGLNFEK